MTQHAFGAAFVFFFLCLIVILVRYSKRAQQTTDKQWRVLLGRLTDLDAKQVAAVALDLIEEDGSLRQRDWPELQAEQIWDLVGGMDGLGKIEANCEVFVEIAMYLQTTYPEAVVIAEEFRRKTRHIQWHINRLRAGQRTGNLAPNFSEYAQRAVASYYLMSKQLVAACEQAHFPGLDQLRVAL